MTPKQHHTQPDGWTDSDLQDAYDAIYLVAQRHGSLSMRLRGKFSELLESLEVLDDDIRAETGPDEMADARDSVLREQARGVISAARRPA